MKGLVIDLFAGGGGASVGIEAALGRSVDIAINHDQVALDVHKANHPGTLHLPTDIWKADPKEVTRGRPVDVLWASPDCTHFSVAKGGKPRKQNIRLLAWVVVRWAKAVKPSVIFLENVGEFRGWGPLDTEGKPIKARMGETFRRWKRALEKLGYVVDYRVLDASVYGTPTRRRRLFLVARCDGEAIRWPEPTHGKGGLPLHTAAECIDWSLPCPSIFERSRPLADKTLWRIAQGIRRFVLENPRPFIVEMNHSNAPRDVADPLGTVTTQHNRFNVVVPTVVGVGGRAGQSGPTAGAEPVGTITAKNDRAIVAPSLVRVAHGDASPDGSKRWGKSSHPLGETLPTVTGSKDFAIAVPTLIQTGYGEREGQAARVPGLDKPLGTLVAGGQKHALVSAFLSKHYGDPGRTDGGGGIVIGDELAKPIGAITSKDHHSFAAATLVKFRGNEENGHPGCADVDAPMPTLSAQGNHIAEVRAFLTAYYGQDGTGGQGVLEPMRTITTKHRLGLVTIAGAEYQIVDIGMRMLEPHELLAAQFGRFAAGYNLEPARTKSAKVRLIGNSVCPEVAEAVVRANVSLEPIEVAA